MEKNISYRSANLQFCVPMAISPGEQQKQDERFMAEALKLAREAAYREEVPVGAVIVSGSRVIARGYNQVETLRDVTAHAEMIAFTAASSFLNGKFLDDCTLYVTIEPCVMCAGASFWSRIGRIVYGAADPKRGYSMHGNLLHPKTLILGGVLEKECGDLMTSFFRSRRD
jgi:tRNA(adenine34) deaminase